MIKDNMKFSLIHPSRSRPGLARTRINEWLTKASDLSQVEYILSIDTTDPNTSSYESIFNQLVIPNAKLVIKGNRNCVQATNEGANISTGDVLIYLSDDFSCPDKWDELLTQAFQGKDPLTDKFSVWVDDTIQKKNKVLTIPIISRALYQHLGYLYNPLYESMYVDCDLYEVCSRLSCLIDRHDLIFPHRHWSNPDSKYKSIRDAAYNTHDNPIRFREGKKIFDLRTKQNFITNGIIK